MDNTLSIYLLPPVLSLVCALYLSILMMARGGPLTGRLLFVVVCLWYSLLAPMFILHHFIADVDTLLSIERKVHFFYVYLPLAMTAYFHHILGIRRNDILVVLFCISLLFSLTTQSEHYIQGFYQYGWGYIARGGPAFQLFGLYGLLTFGYCVWRFRQRLRVETDGALRLKFKYVIFAFGLGTLLTFFNVPAMHGIDWYPPGNFSFLPMAVLAYAVLKYRLVEIESFFQRGLLYVFQIVALLLPNLFLFQWAASRFGAWTAELQFAALVFWFGINHLYLRRLQCYSDHILHKNRDQLQKAENRLIAEMLVLRGTDELVQKTASAVMGVLPFAWVHIYVVDEQRHQLVDPKGDGHPADQRLLAVLADFRGVVDARALAVHPRLQSLERHLSQWLGTLNAAYAVSLMHNDSLVGVLALPRKQNLQALHPDEADFLKNVARPLGLALANAVIHQRITALKDRLEARNSALNQEIAERQRGEERLQAMRDELRSANEALQNAILQANEMTAKAEISNHVLTQEVEDRKRMALMLQQSEERYRLVAENATDVIWTIDMNGRFTFISPSVSHLLGYRPDEMSALEMSAVLTPASLQVAHHAIAEEFDKYVRKSGGSTTRTTELEQVCKDGTTVWTEVNTRFIMDENRRVTGILGVTRDITERKKTEQKLTYLAHHDGLTGLYNRQACIEMLETEIKYARRHGSGLVLLYFDLDKFKLVNDTYGHEIGDRLLVKVAARLKGAVRETDCVARLGGDEFTIVLKHPEQIRHDMAIQRIRRDLARPFRIGDIQIDYVTASIGIATYPRDGETVGALMKCADMGMYQAKKQSIAQACAN